ncbi:autotransporter adhesin [Luteibacter sp. Sphag1AF]|uniref:YadA-like family protein n=1 Tax=Luteibacter sp. Sphag1AF TaxID=2587031 RepID=UPI00161BBD42|nr:YadA-like family protein [Luteibacter sp. Sphag1AF]MBB3228860.1 autotransporter adhesin [Luteibacter sp. Sphag1AF]
MKFIKNRFVRGMRAARLSLSAHADVRRQHVSTALRILATALCVFVGGTVAGTEAVTVNTKVPAAPAATATTEAAARKEAEVTASGETTTTDDDSKAARSTDGTTAIAEAAAMSAWSAPAASMHSSLSSSASRSDMSNATLVSGMASPSLIGPGDPRYPLPAEAVRAGTFIGTGGLVGALTGTLNPVLTTLLDPTTNYLSNGAQRLATVNVTGAYQSLGIGSINTGVNLLGLTQPINGTALGQNQHLTLVGGVTSDSYITNINRGVDGFSSGLLGSVLLPNGSPAWSADCASLLGIPLARCWAVNPAQDNQVIMGDKATANGSQEVVIGRGASHTLPAVSADVAFPGTSRNDPTNPSGVPTNAFATRMGNSVVIGDSASGTNDKQTIIGANATSSTLNSVALGNGSVADRAPLASYTTYGLSTPQTSAGAVAVGATGTERQIAHVAAGTDNYDAVNVLQLKGAMASVSALDLLGVLYDADGNGLPTNSLTLLGAGLGTGPVGLHNLAAGSLAAGSLDGVNGTQLRAANQGVATLLGGGAAVSVAGALTAPTYSVPTIAVGGGVTAQTYSDVGSAFGGLNTSLGNVNTRLTNVYTTGLKYLQVNSTGTASAATGVDSIALGAGATAANANSIALGAGAVTSVGAQTGYTAIGITGAQNSLGEVAVGTRKITGLAAGSAPGDAVNVAQLTGVNAAVTNLARIGVHYDVDGGGNPLNHIALSGTGVGTVGLGNLTAGAITAASTDAVNGAQLFASNSTLAGYLGAGAAVSATGVFTAPIFSVPAIAANGTVTAGTFGTVGDAFTGVGASLSNVNTRVTNLYTTGLKYLQVNSTGVASAATGVDSIALGAGATAANNNSIALGAGAVTSVGAQTGYTAIGVTGAQNSLGEVAVGTRKITGLAAGSALGDAVNVAQLTGVSNAVNTLADITVHYDVDGGGNPLNHVTLSGTGVGTVGLGNLSAGAVTAASTDAINGAQIFAYNSTLAGYLGAGAGVSATGVFTAPTFSVPTIAANGTVTAGTFGNVGDAFTGIGTSLGNVNTRVTNLYTTGLKYLQVNSTGVASVATGVDSIALGAGATAANNNSIALGAGAVTSVGAQTGYDAIGVTGLQNSLGEVAVGTRKITGLAAGSALGDAVNVGQLAGVNTSLTTAVNDLGRITVHYDVDGGGNPLNSVSLTGSGVGAVGLNNVLAGAVTASSTGAINGAQLYATNTTLAGYLGGGAGFNAGTGLFVAPSYLLNGIGVTGAVTPGTFGTVANAFASVDTSLGNVNARINLLSASDSAYVKVNSVAAESSAGGAEGIAIGGAANASAADSLAIGHNAIAGNGNSVALGAGSVTTVGAQTGYTAYGLVAPQTSLGEVNVGTRTISGVSAGRLDNDAVNVAQLRSVSTSVGDLGALAVLYDNDGTGNRSNSITLTGTGVGAVGIHNVAPGSLASTSTDAVNGSQLSAANTYVATSLGGGATFNPATGTFTAPSFAITTVAPNGTATTANYPTVDAAFGAVNGSVTNVNSRVNSIFTTGLKYVQINSTGAASTAAGVDGIAIGAGASASNANSVALGAGSQTLVGAQVGYSAYGLVAPQTSLGEVNVGTRTISGVSAGRLDNDAVNVAQLRSVSTSVGDLSALAVRYDDDGAGNPTDNITLTGSGVGEVGIHNVAAGSLAATSTDAVNGSQLSAANTYVATSLGGGATFNPATGTFTAPSYAITSVTSDGSASTANYTSVGTAFSAMNTSVNNVNTRLSSLYTTGSKYVQVNSTGVASAATAAESVAIGGGATVSNANSVALGSGSATTVGAQLGYLAYGLTAPQTSLGEVNIGTRTISGVSAGRVDDDAVNVAQLRSVSDQAAAMNALDVHYQDDGTGHAANVVVLGNGTGSVAMHNLSNGALTAGSLDAVNGGQLNAAYNAMVTAFGGSASFDPLTSTFQGPVMALRNISPTGVVTPGTYNTTASAFTSVDDSISALNARINGISAGTPTPYLSVSSTGAAATATGVDAVALGGESVAAGDGALAVGGEANATGASATAIGDGAVATGNGALAAGGGAQAQAVGAVAMGNLSQATTEGSVALGTGSVANRTGTGVELFSGVAIPAQGVVSVGSAGAERQITNVAGGTEDTDAVNVRQLRAVDAQIGNLSGLAIQYDDMSHSTATLNRGGASVRLSNVANGAIASGSLDAINGGQLFGWTQDTSNPFSNTSLYNSILALQSNPSGGNTTGLAVNDSNGLGAATAGGGNSVATGAGASSSGANSTTIGNGAQATASNSVAVGAGSVADRANSVSVGTAENNRQITNVAAGTQATDAVNVGQLTAAQNGTAHYDTTPTGANDYTSMTLGGPGGTTTTTIHNVAPGTSATDAANVGQVSQAMDWSRSYTDQRVGSLNQDIQRNNSRASAGVASAMAMAGLPQAMTPGRNMAAVAGGTFRGESSIAVGLSTVSDGGGWVYKVSGTANSRGDAGFSVGAGMEW